MRLCKTGTEDRIFALLPQGENSIYLEPFNLPPKVLYFSKAEADHSTMMLFPTARSNGLEMAHT